MIPKVNPETGVIDRTIDIASIMKGIKIPEWGNPKGRDLFQRSSEGVEYLQEQIKKQIWLYNRKLLSSPTTEVTAMDDNQNIFHGVNFASIDYLGLSTHESAKQAAIQAIQTYGVNSAGSPLAFGATKYYMQLKQQLADFLDAKSVLLYSGGWLAGFGVIKALIKENDYVIMDQLSHNCLQEGAQAATKNVIKFSHLDQDAMEKKLRQTRQKDHNNAILVVTEGLFSMDADSPDLVAYQKICKKYGAFLLIDSAHDFGHVGQNGRGTWQAQNLIDRSNVIMIGTGSKCFGTNVGFVACQDWKVIEFLKYFSCSYMFTNAINPAQAAQCVSILRTIRSQEGHQLRLKLFENYHYLKNQLVKKNRKILGGPCGILPVLIGNQIVNRLVARIMMDMGVHVNGIEYPVVKIGQARIRVSLTPHHTKQHLDTFVNVLEVAIGRAEGIFQREMKVFQEKILKGQNAKL